MSLINKLALVTGAANGIGEEIAKTFAKEGACVIGVDIDAKVNDVVKTFDTTQGQKHSSFICDVSKSDQVNQLYANIREAYCEQKVPNVIVNNAGVSIICMYENLSEKLFDKIISVNLKGTFLVTHGAVKQLIEMHPRANLGPLDTYASVINITSIAGRKGFPYNQCIYAATKGGIDSMTKQSAFDLAQYRIRVNSVAPGPIKTAMNERMPREVSDIHAAMTYFNRLGETSEVAQACVFLASDKSSLITGHVLDVNGGYN